MHRLTICMISLGFLCLSSLPLHATIVTGKVTGGVSLKRGGKFVKLSVPFSESRPVNTVGNNSFNKPNLYGFDEDQNIRIPGSLKVDILADGNGNSKGAGIIPAGTTVASHYIFFDPKSGKQTGEITFDSDIVGIITTTGNLRASDHLANTGVVYQNPGLRGLEKRDSVLITGPRSISVDWKASSPGDYIRVLTEFSPGAVFLLPD